MALENVHLDVLQNIEFAIVSVYREQHDLRDVEVMRALDALIEVYRAEARGHTPKDMSLTGAEGMVFQRTKEICEYRLGRQAGATRIVGPCHLVTRASSHRSKSASLSAISHVILSCTVICARQRRFHPGRKKSACRTPTCCIAGSTHHASVEV
jgi:hypothetical protein